MAVFVRKHGFENLKSSSGSVYFHNHDTVGTHRSYPKTYDYSTFASKRPISFAAKTGLFPFVPKPVYFSDKILQNLRLLDMLWLFCLFIFWHSIEVATQRTCPGQFAQLTCSQKTNKLSQTNLILSFTFSLPFRTWVLIMTQTFAWGSDMKSVSRSGRGVESYFERNFHDVLFRLHFGYIPKSPVVYVHSGVWPKRHLRQCARMDQACRGAASREAWCGGELLLGTSCVRSAINEFVGKLLNAVTDTF